MHGWQGAVGVGGIAATGEGIDCLSVLSRLITDSLHNLSTLVVGEAARVLFCSVMVFSFSVGIRGWVWVR